MYGPPAVRTADEVAAVLAKELRMKRLRWVVFVALSGGTLIQATGCEALLAPIASTLATTVITNLVSGLLLAT